MDVEIIDKTGEITENIDPEILEFLLKLLEFVKENEDDEEGL